MDPVWYLGLFFIVISVALVSFIGLTSIGVAGYVVFQWAKRGKQEIDLDIRDSDRMRSGGIPGVRQ